jgi:hypothetical protein
MSSNSTTNSITADMYNAIFRPRLKFRRITEIYFVLFVGIESRIRSEVLHVRAGRKILGFIDVNAK